MGDINLPAVFLGALAFFAVGAVWYSVLFGKIWQREAGIGAEQMAGANMAVLFALTYLFELLIATLFGHMLARTAPPPHVVMMMAVGIAVGFMAPAIGVNYIYQRRSLKLFLIDAGHFVAGSAAMGLVFLLLS